MLLCPLVSYTLICLKALGVMALGDACLLCLLLLYDIDPEIHGERKM